MYSFFFHDDDDIYGFVLKIETIYKVHTYHKKKNIQHTIIFFVSYFTENG